MRRHYNSVFICHNKEDTQRNAVSVLRGMLRSGGITCFVAGYDKEETEMKFDMIEAIRKSRVHVIFLSPTFVRSKQCLEQIVEIMSVADSSARQGEVKVLPVFYDVEPYMVRYQIKHYDLCNVEGSSKERWANALTSLSHLKGLEYVTSAEDKRFQHFQWETLHKIARKVEACFRKDVISCNNGGRHENIYKEKLNQVFEAWKSEDSKSKDVFVVGVYERKKSQFTKLMVEEFASRRFDAICILSNVMEKLSHPDGPSHLVWKLYSDLTGKLKEEQPSLDDITIFRRHYDQLLRNKRCFVVLSDLGNDIDNLKPLLEIVIENLKNRSLVVLTSRFQRVLQKDVKLDKFISFSSLYDNKGILTIYYGNKGDIHEAFLDQLQETFSMLGLDIHLESKEGLSESTVFQNSEVVLCIVSQSLSIDEFEGMLSNAALHRPRFCTFCTELILQTRGLQSPATSNLKSISKNRS
ncbi:hypothetical protein KP509_15G020100 [Ceratopteris richardii]|nr:hypothetical protein KP509_15G020100 [Ceratopteris richardii]